MNGQEVQLEVGRASRRQLQESSGEPMVAWLTDSAVRWREVGGLEDNEEAEPGPSFRQVNTNGTPCGGGGHETFA